MKKAEYILPKTYHIVTLGCAKNEVDSQSMGYLLNSAKYIKVNEPSQAQVIIVNTCGFIQPARAESLHILKELSQRKKRGQMLIAAGCLTQRYGAEVVRQVPGIDGVMGTRRWMDIVEVVEQIRGAMPPKTLYHLPDTPNIGMDERGVPRVAVQGGTAYLKIADGCRRPCAFCAIPLIKGTAISRPLEQIIAEARLLEQCGVREIILIAQDTTDYGHDLGMKDGLAFLLEQLADTLKEVEWIRILYAFPGYITDRLIEVMATHTQILPYLDMPLQHAHPDTLKRMRRPANIDWIYRTLEKMRQAMPDLALRTTFIVGYPQESEKEFQTLLEFVQEVRFDRVGVFPFSFERGTASEALGDPVPAEVKQARLEQLMRVQQQISLEKNQMLVGKTLRALIEGNTKGLAVGRSYRDAPEIDGLVFVEGEWNPGEMVNVRVHSAMPYDLAGTVVPVSISNHILLTH